MRQFFVETAGGPPGLSPQAKEADAEAFYAALCGVFGGADRVMAAYSEHVLNDAKPSAWLVGADLARKKALAPELAGADFACAFLGDFGDDEEAPERFYVVDMDGAQHLRGAKQATVLARYVTAMERRFGRGDALEAAWWEAERALIAAAGAQQPPVTAWESAHRAAEDAAWAGMQRPAGAALTLRFTNTDAARIPYHVELKAPELAAPIRAQLEREFRIALDRLCGNEGAAAAAVHAQWDGEDWGPRGRNLDELSHEIVSSLRARLPAGARFTCWPNIAYLSAPAALSR